MRYAFVLPLVAFLTTTPVPDEGQWLPQQILAKDWSELRARGMQLSKDEFWHPEKGGVLSAAVQLGGCSASFVSANGLVVTNHHCAFSALQRVSNVETNYLRDGFVAASREAEIPAPGTVVYVVRRIRDVTEEVHAAQAKAETDLERWQLTQRVIDELVEEGQREPNTVCHVASFLEGQSYNMYYRTRIPDVRLVAAPPRSVGEFGGEVDNWEWPRHTGDFTFLRAYVAPDGTPRDYSPENVPFRPDHFLKVSAKGVHRDDLVLILGYPGRTERYLTSVAVQDRQTVYYPMRHEVFSAIIDVLESAGEDDEATALRYASLKKSLANVQKNALGMIEGLARNAVVERKVREEKALGEWIAAAEGRGEKYGTVVTDMLALDEEARTTTAKDTVLPWLQSAGLVPLFGNLVRAVRSLKASDGGTPSRRMLAALGSESMTRDFEAVQAPILSILLQAAASMPEGQRIRGLELVVKDAAGDAVGDVVPALLPHTDMLDGDKRAELFAGGLGAVAASKDPLVVMARGVAAEMDDLAKREQARSGRLLVVGQRWIEAQQAWRGTSFYPDANSTLRVSVASVKAYSPRDGVLHTPHTTVAGILAKETGEEPFASPAPLLAAAAMREGSKFFDPVIGDVPVCFLSDGDTTGGNSGSPVVNGRGELVGLNFDRVFEAVSGDYGWGAARSRNISVDVRYVLWVIESVLKAPHLLQELGV